MSRAGFSRLHKPKPAPCEDVEYVPRVVSDMPFHQQDLETGLSFYNNTGTTLYIMTRDNVVATIPPRYLVGRSDDSPRELIIVKRYTASRDISIRHETHSDLDMGEKSEEMHEIKRLVHSERGRDRNGAHLIAHQDGIVYRYSENQMKDNPNGVYCREVDAVIGTTADVSNVIHPNSELEQRTHMLMNELDDSESGGGSVDNVTAFRMRIVDNEDEIGDRYINLAGNVVPVPKIKSDNLKSGVYYLVGSDFSDSGKRSSMVYRHMSFEKAEETLEIYTTRERARCHGDRPEDKERQYKLDSIEMRSRLDKEEADRRQQHAEFKAKMDAEEICRKDEHAKLKAKLEKEEADRKRRLSELEDRLSEKMAERKKEAADLEVRRAETKYRHENRNIARKETVEWLKFIPAVVGFAVAAFAFFL